MLTDAIWIENGQLEKHLPPIWAAPCPLSCDVHKFRRSCSHLPSCKRLTRRLNLPKANRQNVEPCIVLQSATRTWFFNFFMTKTYTCKLLIVMTNHASYPTDRCNSSRGTMLALLLMFGTMPYPSIIEKSMNKGLKL